MAMDTTHVAETGASLPETDHFGPSKVDFPECVKG